MTAKKTNPFDFDEKEDTTKDLSTVLFGDNDKTPPPKDVDDDTFFAQFNEKFDGLILQRRVMRLCKKKNLSTARAERKLGFANGTLKKLDRNIPSASKIFEMANFFEVTSDYLLGLSNRKKVPNIDRLDTLWQSLDIDQQNYVLGFINGMIKYEQENMKDTLRPEPLIMKRRRAIRNQMDELEIEYSALEKIRKRKGYS